MKWRVINDNSYENAGGDLLTTLLNNRGVEDIQSLLNVNENNIYHWSELDGIYEGIEMYRDHMSKGSHVHIIQDSDFDGVSSATYFYNYTYRNYKIKCTFHMHPKKEHGIIIKELKALDYFDDIDLIVAPDSGSFDYKAHEELIKLGKDILILDHHSPEEGEEIKNTKAIVINPQLDKYPNKTLAGVGVVHKFFEGIDELEGFNNSKNYLDLVACGCVADSVDLRDLETRYYVLKGIEQMKRDKERRLNDLPIIGNTFIQEIIKSKEDKKLKHINIHSIGWEIAPIINGMCRYGKMPEKADSFRACIGEQEERFYQPRRKHKEDPKPEPISETLQKAMVRACVNAKGRQDGAKAKGVEKLEVKILEKGLDKNKILTVDGSDIFTDGALTGVVAGGLANKYKKPCIILRKKEEGIYGGSMRNYSMSPIENFQKFLTDSNEFSYIKGHPNAGGIEIKLKNLFTLNATLEEMLKDIPMEDVYLVDYEIPIGRLSKEQVIQVGEMQDIWGNTLHKPQFAITNIKIPTKDIELIGDRKNVLKFKKNDFTFIKFFANEDLLNDMKMKKKTGFAKAPKMVKMDLIVEMEVNSYENVNYPQLTIIDFNVQKEEELLF